MGVTTSWYDLNHLVFWKDVSCCWDRFRSHYWAQSVENGGKNAVTLVNFGPFTDKPESSVNWRK